MTEEKAKSKMDVISQVPRNSMDLDDNKSLYQKARQIDNSIMWKDILEWKRRRQKSPMKGFNSYVANLPREQYQMDLAHIQPMMKSIMEDKDPEHVEQAMNIPYKFCFICVDVFSKRVFAKAQKTGNQAETKQSVIDAFNQMGIPKQIYTDRGTELQASGPLLKENNVEHIQTRAHAAFAKR